MLRRSFLRILSATLVASMEGGYFCAIHPNMKGALTGV